jgi:hypothetical protein
MSDFYEDLEAIRVHQIASGCQQNLFLFHKINNFLTSFGLLPSSECTEIQKMLN